MFYQQNTVFYHKTSNVDWYRKIFVLFNRILSKYYIRTHIHTYKYYIYTYLYTNYNITYKTKFEQNSFKLCGQEIHIWIYFSTWYRHVYTSKNRVKSLVYYCDTFIVRDTVLWHFYTTKNTQTPFPCFSCIIQKVFGESEISVIYNHKLWYF